jgi:hypothetical protein
LFRNEQQFCFLQAAYSAQLNCGEVGKQRQVTYPAAYVSFLIRLWRERSLEHPEEVADWQGDIEHIQTGQRWTFGTLDELLSFLRRQVEDAEVLCRS